MVDFNYTGTTVDLSVGLKTTPNDGISVRYE
jgi:hypothetical protein